MAREPEKTAEEGEPSTFDERLTWNAGDIEFVDADGKPLDPKKMQTTVEEADEQPGPTVHIFLPEDDA